jgi:hypothetical protein
MSASTRLVLDDIETLDWTVPSLWVPRIVAVLAAMAASGVSSNERVAELPASAGRAVGSLWQAARNNATAARSGVAGNKRPEYRESLPNMMRIDAPCRSAPGRGLVWFPRMACTNTDCGYPHLA